VHNLLVTAVKRVCILLFLASSAGLKGLLTSFFFKGEDRLLPEHACHGLVDLATDRVEHASHRSGSLPSQRLHRIYPSTQQGRTSPDYNELS